MIYLMKKYEGKNSYHTPWGHLPCTVENGLAILALSTPNISKYIMNRYGFKPYVGYQPNKEEKDAPRASNGRFAKKSTTKKSTPKKSTKKKTTKK